MTHQTGIVGKF